LGNGLRLCERQRNVVSVVRRRFATVSVVLFLAALTARPADQWTPDDPREYSTEVDFSLTWAKRLEGFKTLVDLQRAAKAKGTIKQRSLEGDDPYVSFHWRSEPPKIADVGYMLATVRPDGKITANILTTDKHAVIVNNTGLFSVEQAK